MYVCMSVDAKARDSVCFAMPVLVVAGSTVKRRLTLGPGTLCCSTPTSAASTSEGFQQHFFALIAYLSSVSGFKQVYSKSDTTVALH